MSSFQKLITLVDELYQESNQAMSLLIQIKQNKDGYLSHPFLGQIRLQRVPLFLRIHTAHHLQIIREIMNKINILDFQNLNSLVWSKIV